MQGTDNSAVPPWPADPALREQVLPDGRRVLVAGDEDRFDFAAGPPAGASSAACCARLCAAIASAAGEHPACLAALSPGAMVARLRAAGYRSAELAFAQSLEELAQAVETGEAVVALVDAGVCWNWPPAVGIGAMNHALIVVALLRDARSGLICAALVRDPARPGQLLRLDEAALIDGWLAIGGGWIWAGRRPA